MGFLLSESLALSPSLSSGYIHPSPHSFDKLRINSISIRHVPHIRTTHHPCLCVARRQD